MQRLFLLCLLVAVIAVAASAMDMVRLVSRIALLSGSGFSRNLNFLQGDEEAYNRLANAYRAILFKSKRSRECFFSFFHESVLTLFPRTSVNEHFGVFLVEPSHVHSCHQPALQSIT